MERRGPFCGPRRRCGAGRAFDSTTPFVQQLIWASVGAVPGQEDPVSVVNGIDARLIEAEVQLFNNDVAGWLAILNILRAGPTQLSPGVRITGMPALVDPGTPAARLSLQSARRASGRAPVANGSATSAA